MSVVIEQTPEQARSAFALHMRADLEEIRLAQSTVKCFMKLGECQPPHKFDINFRPGPAQILKREQNEIVTSTVFAFVLTCGNESTKAVILTCELKGHYRLDDEYVPSKEEIDAFRRGNAVFNSWPYFREYVTSTFTRMGYPPPSVPFLRLLPKKKIDSKQKARKSVGSN